MPIFHFFFHVDGSVYVCLGGMYLTIQNQINTDSRAYYVNFIERERVK